MRTVHRCGWHQVGDELRLVIGADAYLRHQVRTLVGTMLVEPDPVRMVELLAGAPRGEAGPTAPPWALFLSGVRYEGEPEGVEFSGIDSVGGAGASVP